MRGWIWTALSVAAMANAAAEGASRCSDEATISAGRFARFCVLTPRVIRMEWSPSSSEFRDSSTLVVETRRVAELPAFNVSTEGNHTTITTEWLRLEYDASAATSFSDANLAVTIKNSDGKGGTARWTPSTTDAARQDALPGTVRTLDGSNGSVSLDCMGHGAGYARDSHCTSALFSRARGYAVLDDSLSATLDEDPAWPWLRAPRTASPPSKDSCEAIPTKERRICGLETVSESQCTALGCCFSPSTTVFPLSSETNRSNPGFQCFYAPTSYQDLYLFGHGHDFKAALKDFTLIAGRIPLPPRFALGVIYSRWWAYSDQEIRDDIVGQYEAHGLPLDVVVVDMDWHLTFYKERATDQAGQGKGWTGLTWNRELFPDPVKFLAALHAKGVAVTLNLHPASGVQPWEDSYTAVAKAVGIDPASNKYVPFRITNRTFVDAWMSLAIGAREREGVDFWWLDWQQGEDWIERNEGGRLDVNPTLWLNRVFFTNPHHWNHSHTRPVLLHRFGGLGNHRYPLGFSGDTYTSWATLAFQPYFSVMASNIGFGYWSHDIGGFQNPTPPELLVRWVQWGAFAPVFRSHSTKDAANDRRVWKYKDDTYELTRAAMRLRAALVPYLYSEAAAASITGVSALHGVFLDWPEHDEAYTFREQYMLGGDLLVSPVVAPIDSTTKLADKVVWLPPGKWYDMTTGLLRQGPAVINSSYALSEVPWFVRAGAILPLSFVANGVSSVGQFKHAPTALRLVIVPGNETGRLELYDDDGLTQEYLHEAHSTTVVEYQSLFPGTTNVTIQAVNGSFDDIPSSRVYVIELRAALPIATASVNGHFLKLRGIDGHDQAEGFTYDAKTLSAIIVVRVPNVHQTTHVSITHIAASPKLDTAALLHGDAVGLFARFQVVKSLLDNQWSPDSGATVFMSDYPHLIAASETVQRIQYAPERVLDELSAFQSHSAAARDELGKLSGLKEPIRAQALAFISCAHPSPPLMQMVDEVAAVA